MKYYVEWIVKQGYHDVATHKRSFSKKHGVNPDEFTRIEFVGIDQDGQCWRGRLTVTKRLGPGRKSQQTIDYKIASRDAIPPDEHAKSTEEFGGILDTPQYYRDKLEIEERKRETRIKRTDMYQRMRPDCPACGAKMVLQKTSNTAYVWGCSRHPACQETRDISPVILQRLLELGFLK